MLRVENLVYSRGGRNILDGVSLAVAGKEFVALIGPNGAGKSTLLRHVAGALPVAPRRVILDGRCRTTLTPREAARIVAYVPQVREPEIPFTSEEIVMQSRYPFLSVWGAESDLDRKRVAEAMALVGIDDLQGRTFATLSGGEQQKVFIAAALAQDAALLLLDEPTTFLDPPFQDEIFTLIERVRREKEIALLVVTHDINRVLVTADRIVAMREGAIVLEGTPDEFADEEKLAAVYGSEFLLTPHPQIGRPMVVPRVTGGEYE